MEELALGPSLEEECVLDCRGTNFAPHPRLAYSGKDLST